MDGFVLAYTAVSFVCLQPVVIIAWLFVATCSVCLAAKPYTDRTLGLSSSIPPLQVSCFCYGLIQCAVEYSTISTV